MPSSLLPYRRPSSLKLFFHSWSIIALLLASPAAYALTPQQVMILVNKDTPISSDVAKMYQKLRGIPAENVLRLSAGASRQISREQYQTRLAEPLERYLRAHPTLQCIVTTSGVPYVITATPGTQDGAAVDNELAGVLRPAPKDWNQWQPNPLYLRGQNLSGADSPRLFQMVYVSRLDGPDLKTIKRMVEDAIATEATGLDGPVFGDAMGLDGNTGTAAADFSIRAALDTLSGAGFPATLDLNQADWKQPAGGVGEQAAGAAFYLGWYDLQNFQDIFGKQGLARGAIAWHIASDEATNLWDTNSREWCINLMRRGAAVTIGPAFEPYVAAFPKAEIFVESLLVGRTIAESYWVSLPHVSWAMVLLGDPLYRPFAAHPQPALVARGYVADNATHILEHGQTGSMLVRIQCVGPAGSGLPAFTTAAESQMGLAGASGTASIPALRSGEVAVVHIPVVHAGSDPTGMFRLQLNAQSANGEKRRIFLEGRTGFSAITGGIDRQTQMFLSPRGDTIISGRPGSTYVTDIATLQTRRLDIASGWGIVGAIFSPAGSHVVLILLNPEKKQAGFGIADARMEHPQTVPEGAQFMGWLNETTVLLRRPGGLSEYDIAASTSLPVFEPPGWTVNNIIQGNAAQILTSKDGKVGIKPGGAEIREILSGAGLTRERAVADDLSQFGGLDAQGHLWVQQGFQAAPKIVAEDVMRVGWGPVSRRALVEKTGGTFSVYDGRNGNWTKLPPLVAAQWSPDENRLLLIEAPQQGAQRSLVLWTGGQTQSLCDMNRIGDVDGMIFSGDTAFLLAGPEGDMHVWLTALPPSQPKR